MKLFPLSVCVGIVGISAAASLFLIFSPLVVQSDAPPIVRHLLSESFLVALPFVVAYLSILVGFRNPSPKVSFVRALSIGHLVFLMEVLVLVPAAVLIDAVGDVPRRVLVLTFLLPLVQIPLTLGAIDGYRLLPPAERGDWRIFAKGFGATALYLLIGIVLSAGAFIHSPTAAADSLALGAVREIRDCAETFYRSHPDLGYPSTLLSLGPEGEGCIGDGLADGERGGHVFDYTSAPDDDGYWERFAVAARPRKYGYTGGHSYWIDETGVARASPSFENRAAGPRILPGSQKV